MSHAPLIRDGRDSAEHRAFVGADCPALHGLAEALDLVHGFRVYTTLVIVVDFLRHGSQYVALLSVLHAVLLPTRRSATLSGLLQTQGELAWSGVCSAMGLVLTAANQVLLAKLLGHRRVSFAGLLWGGMREPAGGVLAVVLPLFVLVAILDLLVLAVRLDVTRLVRQASQGRSPPIDGDTVERPASSVGWAVLLVVSQALLRSIFVLALRWAHRWRSGKALP